MNDKPEPPPLEQPSRRYDRARIDALKKAWLQKIRPHPAWRGKRYARYWKSRRKKP